MAEGPTATLTRSAPIREVEIGSPEDLDTWLCEAREPFVVRNLVSDWPLVKAGMRSAREAREYLVRHHRDRSFPLAIGDPRHHGRLFYDETMGMNFRQGDAKLPEVFAHLDRYEGDAEKPSLYFASIDMKAFFDGLHEANTVDLAGRNCLASIWMGTATRIAAHNDFPHNLACCAVGRRRFTLFPPDQFENLYIGPLDNTPAGRPISMVDLAEPDLDRYPRFADALAQAQAAELAPGDAIFIPSMWWHHVEGLSAFNVLVNYWWRDTPAFLGQPEQALNHAILAIRDLPAHERQIWRELFEHYVFDASDDVVAHLPPDARGILAPLTSESAGRLRAFLLRGLSR